MNDTEFLNQTEHVSDIFTRIMLKVAAADLGEGSSDEITPAQFEALKRIAGHGACSIGALADALSVSQPAATMLVDRMARRGLVQRRTGRSDRRQAEVSLTPHAKDLIEKLDSGRAKRLRRIIGLMKPHEAEQFVESIECFVAAALKLECSPDEACLRCGTEHQDDCIVNQTNLEVAGEQIART